MLGSMTVDQLTGVWHEYHAEPEPAGSDEATERDLRYFDRLMALLDDELGGTR